MQTFINIKGAACRPFTALIDFDDGPIELVVPDSLVSRFPKDGDIDVTYRGREVVDF